MQAARDERGREHVGKHVPALLSVFGQLLGSDALKPQMQSEIAAFLCWLRGQAPQQIDSIVGRLPDEERAKISLALHQ